MGAFFTWFFGKPQKQLEEMKQIKLRKIEKLQEEILAIENEIKRQNDEK